MGGAKRNMKNMKIDANGTEIRVMGDVVNEDAYISLTDIAKYKNPDNAFIVVANWMRNHSTISFLGLWEQIHNPNFKPIEFDRFKAESGDNAFTLTPQQWIKATDAIGIVSKSGRYGGTYAHTDIAFEFASWISPEFKLYIIKDYQRLKKDEADRLAIGWDVKRELSKNKLSYPYRCSKRIFDNAHIISAGNGIYIRFRSRYSKYGFVWKNSITMEK